MDPPSYTQNNVQLPMDQEKGQTNPLLPSAHAGYSTVFNAAPVEDRHHRRSRRRRICIRVTHLLMLDVLLLLFFPHFFTDMKNLAQSMRGFFGGYTSGGEVSLPHDCAEVLNWETLDDHDHDHHHGLPHGVYTDIDLPVSSDLLYFLSQGSLSHGAIQFFDTGAKDSDVASVNVKFFYDADHLVDLAKVCRLQKGESDNGVGIFSPQWTHSPRHHRSVVEVTVKLPSSSFVNALETNMPLFAHDLADFRDSVLFKSVSLRTTNMPISAKYLSSSVSRVQTTNAHIFGSFNSTESIDLSTTNAPIDVGLILAHSGGDSGESHANLHTSNAHVKAVVSLNSTAKDNVGGKFNVVVKTTNAPIDVKFDTTPVDSILGFDGSTSNAPAKASLHETFEGDFSIQTGRWFGTDVHVDDKKDPSGQDRKRKVTSRVIQRGHAEGTVLWEDAKDRKLGHASLTTSNSPVQLNL